MRTLWMVVVVLLVGASGCGRRRVQVANTPEGNVCQRECMSLFNACQGGQRKNRKTCEARENECRATCPGAVPEGAAEEASVQPAATVSPAAPTLGTICTASELPEWQGADAVTKRELMAKCRAPTAEQ